MESARLGVFACVRVLELVPGTEEGFVKCERRLELEPTTLRRL